MKLASAIFLLAALLFTSSAEAQTCPQQTSPQFNVGGNVFGRLASQWNIYFTGKVDKDNGSLCNATVTNTRIDCNLNTCVNVPIAALSSSAITFGSQSVSLGGTLLAPLARGPTVFNIDAWLSIGNVDATLSATNRTVATSTLLGVSRTWTLPPANSVNAGQVLRVLDAARAVSQSNQLNITAGGTDKINKVLTTVSLWNPGSSLELASDGVSNWGVVKWPVGYGYLNTAAISTTLSGNIPDFLFGTDGGSPGRGSIGIGTNGFFIGVRANGTAASPSAVLLDEMIGVYGSGGHDGTGWVLGTGGATVRADQNWSAGANGTYFTVDTLAPGTTGNAPKRMEVHSGAYLNAAAGARPSGGTNGDIGVGTWNVPQGYYVGGALTSAGNGYVNKLRNSSLNDWFNGTSLTITTAGGWGAEGIYVVPTGASVTVTQVANSLTNPLSFWAQTITGAASVTDVKLRFVIESYDAAAVAGKSVTCQFPLLNNVGSTITPTLQTKFPTAQDNWTTSTTDLAATNLQPLSNGATGTVAYTFVASASAKNGYEAILDLGAMVGGQSATLGGGFDCRATPGIPTGLNANPPAPEIAPVSVNAARDQSYFETSYNNGVAPGTVTTAGEGRLFQQGFTSATNTFVTQERFRATKRCNPTMTAFSPASGTSGKVRDTINSADVNASFEGQGAQGFGISGALSVAATTMGFSWHWAADCRGASGGGGVTGG
jgi:hypothetical protein